MESWGFNYSMDVKSGSPTTLKSRQMIQDYIIKLCKIIGLERHRDCIIETLDNGNLAVSQSAEIALITGIFTDSCAYIDITSSGEKPFNPNEVMAFTQEFFDAMEIATHAIFR